MKFNFKIIFVFLLLNSLSFYDAAVPLVMWHGMGDTCCNPLSLGRIKNLIEETVPGIYVLSLKIGNNFEEDTMNGFFKNVNEQIKMACSIIKNDTKLSNGFNAVGFSQGGQFLRAVVQRCNVRVFNLISIGGQHQGVYGFPNCPKAISSICDIVRRLLNLGAYKPFIQNHLVQAEYWHDPLNEKEYQTKSVFLADINNEQKFNASYRTNLMALRNFVMVKFLNDTMVVPIDSEWFGFYAPGQADKIVSLQNSTIYTKDLLGLKVLDKSNRLKFLSTVGEHLQFTDQWFVDNIIKPFMV